MGPEIIQMIVNAAPTLVWIDLLNHIIQKSKDDGLPMDVMEEAMNHLIVERARKIIDEKASQDPKLAAAREQALAIQEAMDQDEVEENLVAKAKRIINERKENKE